MSERYEVAMERPVAVAMLAESLRSRAHWVVFGPPEATPSLGHRLRLLDGPEEWVALLDDGQPIVCATTDAEDVIADSAMVPIVAIVLVSKSVPASRLSQVLQYQPIAGDGTQDLIMLSPPSQPQAYHWPMLLVDAIGVIDPAYAAAIRATDPAAQS